MPVRRLGRVAPRVVSTPKAAPRQQINPANFRPLFEPEDRKFIAIKPINRVEEEVAPVDVNDPLMYVPEAVTKEEPKKKPKTGAKKNG